VLDYFVKLLIKFKDVFRCSKYHCDRCHSGGRLAGPKMTSPGGKLTALACHPIKNLNKAEELTYLSTKNGIS
jgi:hypothetical protein